MERNGAKLYSARRPAALSMAVIALSLSLPTLMLERFSQPERKIFASWTDRSVYRCGKLFRILHPGAGVCEITVGSKLGSGRLLLIGDSHADAIKASFARIASAHGYRVFLTVENDPQQRPDRLIAEAKALNVEAVFLHFARKNYSEQIIGVLLTRLKAENIKTVLLMPTPEYDVSVPAALYDHLTKGDVLPTQDFDAYHNLNQRLFEYAESKQSAGLAYYDFASVLCRPQCQLTDREQRPLYFDHGHLTLSGAALLEPDVCDGNCRSEHVA